MGATSILMPCTLIFNFWVLTSTTLISFSASASASSLSSPPTVSHRARISMPCTLIFNFGVLTSTTLISFSASASASSLSSPKRSLMASPSSNSKPLLPWKTRLSILLATAVTDALRGPDGTLNRRFMNFLDRKTNPNPKPVEGVKSSDITVDHTRNLWFRLFTPTTTTKSSSLPVIVFFHGGGFTYLSAASLAYDAVCRQFARQFSAIVISVNYRLIPEHRYPAQYDDGFDVLKFIDQNDDALLNHADLSKCFLAGDSAGANLAHNVAVRVCRSRLQNVRVIGLISIQPFFGGEERTESEIRLVNVPLVSVERTDWIWKVLLPEGWNRDHEAVNVSGPNAVDISGMDYPATIVFVGGFDPLKDWQMRYYEWLKKSGKEAELMEYPNSIHAFYVFPELPEASKLLSQVKDFIHKRLSKLQ